MAAFISYIVMAFYQKNVSFYNDRKSCSILYRRVNIMCHCGSLAQFSQCSYPLRYTGVFYMKWGIVSTLKITNFNSLIY